MKRMGLKWVLLVVLVLAGTAAVYGVWHGATQTESAHDPAQPGHTRTIAYYRHPGGEPDYSPEPKKDAQGRDYLPVYQDEEAESSPAPSQNKPEPADGGKSGKILYYRNPMGLADVSPVPKKDPMGMDYIPVYEGEAGGGDITVQVSPGRMQLLGVRTDTVQTRRLVRTIRAAGTLQPDETTLTVVAPKYEGWIEILHANATGMAVRRGQPLMEVYAPEAAQALQEYQDILAQGRVQGAEKGANVNSLAQAALRRLRNLDLSKADVSAHRSGKSSPRTVTLRAPRDGIVMEKKAVQGMRFMPGEMLYQIADLTTLWVLAEVFEGDLASLRVGQQALVRTISNPGEPHTGRVGFIYPVVTPETRTVRVRIEIPNPDLRLKPGMFASVELQSPLGSDTTLVVPDSAVLDSGVRQAVLVELSPGRFQPRAVTLGAQAEGYQEVLTGLKPDERVVVSANFLIDSESNLKAAFLGFSAPATGSGKEAQ